IRAALDAGATTILVGAGGSATNDGGAGALVALGVRLLDREGATLSPGGGALATLDAVDLSGLDPRLANAEIAVATDVRNPLLGPEGATAVYGPQKGATSEAIEELEASLSNFADVVERTCAVRVRDVPGAGAAGGLAFGLAAVAGARIVPGFDEIARAMKLDQRLAGSDEILTGEGRVDVQTGYGKGPFALAQHARRTGRPVTCFTGARAPGARAEDLGFERIVEVSPDRLPNRDEAARQLEDAAFRWARERAS
ncbi:MAG: glycerate kinase, partial [Myxococcaceae bacterium]